MDGHWPSSSLSTGCMVSLGGKEPFSVTLAQDGLAACDQPGKNPLKYSAVAGGWTRAARRTDSQLLHWAIMAGSIYIKRNIFYSPSGMEILNTIRYSWLFLTREERWSSDSRGVILTLVIHWLGPTLFLLWCSTAMLAVFSGRLAKGPYQGNNLVGSETRTCNPLIATRGFYRLSYPGSILKT